MLNVPIKIKNKEWNYVARYISQMLVNEIIMNMLDRNDFTSEQRDFIDKVGKEFIEQFKEG